MKTIPILILRICRSFRSPIDKAALCNVILGTNRFIKSVNRQKYNIVSAKSKKLVVLKMI